MYIIKTVFYDIRLHKTLHFFKLKKEKNVAIKNLSIKNKIKYKVKIKIKNKDDFY